MFNLEVQGQDRELECQVLNTMLARGDSRFCLLRLPRFVVCWADDVARGPGGRLRAKCCDTVVSNVSAIGRRESAFWECD